MINSAHWAAVILIPIAVCNGGTMPKADSVISSAATEFPYVAAGVKYEMQKVFDPTTKTIKFKSKQFASADEMENLSRENRRLVL
jgi:hypothetical protein